MSLWVKQSTAVTVVLGPFVDSTDGVTAETALTISQADIRLSKNGGAFAQTNNVAGATHMENGNYSVPLDATDTNTLGTLTVRVNETGALPVWLDLMVVPANVWDSLFGADKLQVDATEWLGGAIATPTVAGVPEVDVTHWLGAAAPANTGDAFARLGAPAGASVSADVAAVKAETASIQSDTNDIQTRLPAALVGGRMDANVGAISADAAAADNLEAAFDDTAGAVRWTGIIDQGTLQSATATTAVLRAGASFADDRLIGMTLVITGGTGAGQSRVITDYVDATDTATVDTWTTTPDATSTYQVLPSAPASASSPAPVNVVQLSGDATAADNAESFFDGTGYAGTGNTIPTVTTVGTVNALAANSLTAAAAAADFGAELADAVWDEATAGHQTAGTTGKALTDAGSAGDPWATALPGAYGAGTAGKIVGDNVNATISSRSSHSAADVWAVATRTLTAFDSAFKTGYSLSTAGVQAIWDALTSALTTAGSIGKLLVDNINATISSRSSHSAADVWSSATRTLTSFGTLVADVWANATRTLTGSQGIKKNEAKAGFMFLMTDSTNHAPTTGYTVTATRSIDGAAFAACANPVAEVGNGWYKINLAASDLNGDTIALRFTATGADPLNIAIVTGA